MWEESLESLRLHPSARILFEQTKFHFRSKTDLFVRFNSPSVHSKVFSLKLKDKWLNIALRLQSAFLLESSFLCFNDWGK